MIPNTVFVNAVQVHQQMYRPTQVDSSLPSTTTIGVLSLFLPSPFLPTLYSGGHQRSSQCNNTVFLRTFLKGQFREPRCLKAIAISRAENSGAGCLTFLGHGYFAHMPSYLQTQFSLLMNFAMLQTVMRVKYAKRLKRGSMSESQKKRSMGE